MVGVSGKALVRVFDVTASARSLPSLTSGTAGVTAPNETGVWPATVEPIAGPPPLKGTWTRSGASESRNSSPTSEGGVPTPGDAKLYLPGLPLTSATSSFTDCAGTDGCTVSTTGWLAPSVTASKSRIGSYGT